jgi:hypothetical protein
MGMFDSVVVRCPKCRRGMEFQSKAGECILAQYAPEDAPLEITNALSDETQEC